MKKISLNQPLMESVLEMHTGHFGGIVLSGKALEIMYQIQKELSPLAPVGDDDVRSIWLQVPRGKPSDWVSFKDAEVKTRAEYLKEWKMWFPDEYEWYEISTSTYRNITSLYVRKQYIGCTIFTNKDIGDCLTLFEDVSDFLEALRCAVRDKVAIAVSDIDAYNTYVAENLPFEQRKGRIKRSDLNKIVPKKAIKIKSLNETLKILRECRKVHGEPFDTMSIRIFCKYYRIADECFAHAKHDDNINDIQYYEWHKANGLNKYDLDSLEDFKKFAVDHYGELSISRINIGAAKEHSQGKWAITLSICYSSHIKIGAEIAVALYKSGCPFIFFDADKVRAAIEANDYVLLQSFTYHDYIDSHNEGSVMSIPTVQECGPDGEMTIEQRDEILSHAEWYPEVDQVLEEPANFDAEVCMKLGLTEDNKLPVNEIRKYLLKEKDVCVAASYDYNNMGPDNYSYYIYDRKTNKSSRKNDDAKRYRTWTDAIRAALITYSKGF